MGSPTALCYENEPSGVWFPSPHTNPPDAPPPQRRAQLDPPGTPSAGSHHASAARIRLTSGASDVSDPFSQNTLAARNRSRHSGAISAASSITAELNL